MAQMLCPQGRVASKHRFVSALCAFLAGMIAANGCHRRPLPPNSTLAISHGSPGEIWVVPAGGDWTPRVVPVDDPGISLEILPTSKGLFIRQEWTSTTSYAGAILRLSVA